VDSFRCPEWGGHPTPRHRDGPPPRALRLLGPLTATLARRRIERDYRRLKSLLESGVVW